MKHFIFTISFRFLIVACMSLTATLVHANTCNLGLGGEGDGGVGGTGIVSQGVGGTGISSDGNDEVTNQGQGLGGTGAKVTESGIGGTGAKVTESGIGGTGAKMTESGIGGTGAKMTESGIGGTGAKMTESGIGGTGIVGVITGFASICVNGVEAHYDNSTQIDINGVPANIENLNIGQLVAIDARGHGAEVKAQRVSVIHTLVGRVDEVNASKNQIKIMKQVVQLGNNQGANNFKPGQSVAISGLFTDNGILRATRADVVADSTPSSVTGALNKGKVLGVPVTLPANNAHLSTVQVSGRWDGKTLKVNEVKTAPTEQVMRPGQAFDLQGTVANNGKTAELQILGKPIVVSKDVKVIGDKTLKNAVVIVRGQINNEGRAVTRELEYRSFEKILERGGSKERPAIDVRFGKEKSNDSADADLDSKDAKFNKEAEKNHTKHMDIESVKNPDKIERSDRQKRSEKFNLLDKPEKVEKVEKPEKAEKIEKPEKVEKIEKPEKVEKIEREEHVERVEREEHVERDH